MHAIHKGPLLNSYCFSLSKGTLIKSVLLKVRKHHLMFCVMTVLPKKKTSVMPQSKFVFNKLKNTSNEKDFKRLFEFVHQFVFETKNIWLILSCKIDIECNFIKNLFVIPHVDSFQTFKVHIF